MESKEAFFFFRGSVGDFSIPIRCYSPVSPGITGPSILGSDAIYWAVMPSIGQ